MNDPALFGLHPKHEADIGRQILRILRDVLFLPLLEVLNVATAQPMPRDIVQMKNAPGDALQKALREGRVQYEAGVFSGKFNAAITRILLGMGAKFDQQQGVFRLSASSVPGWVVAEATAYLSTAKSAHERLLKTLDETAQNLEKTLETKSIDANIELTELEKAWKVTARNLEVNPEISQGGQENLRRAYDQNMKLAIKGWMDEQIPRLRKVVRDNAEQGYRFDKLIPAIKARFQVGQSKAAFLARQETSLLVSKFRQERFQDIGVTDYIWMTSHDVRVRHDHRDLDKTRQSYANPPITDKTTGARNNPGEDYNCRCVARPILPGSQEVRRAA
jgi:SPP1 gp7 family putative phage head morphogenesis protein